MGDSFHRRMGSSRRDRNRSCCSPSLTENQYLRSKMPSSTSSRSKIGHWCRNRAYSSLVQNPITCSTPARLYQDRSNSVISPAAGRCSMYRWKYHWVAWRSVGLGSAAICATREFRSCVPRLIVPPLPAASRPSKMITIRAPAVRIHSWTLTSSPCSRYSSALYAFLGSFSGSVSDDAGGGCAGDDLRDLPDLAVSCSCLAIAQL